MSQHTGLQFRLLGLVVLCEIAAMVYFLPNLSQYVDPLLRF
jgi:hypothetical protein